MRLHTRKRGDSWYYSFELAPVDGKRKRIERKGGRTKKEAEAAGTVAMAEYNSAGSVFEPSKISFSDFLDQWLQQSVLLNCEPNTYTGYGMIIRVHIKPTLGQFPLSSLSPTVLQQLINDKYLEGYSKHYLDNIYSVLSGSLKYAVYPLKYLQHSPMEYVKMPKYEQKVAELKKKVLSYEEFSAIINRFGPDSSFYILIMLGYHAGLRIGETTSLCWEDVDFDNNTISINKSLLKKNKRWFFGPTKTRPSIRTIKIGPTLIRALRQHKLQQMKNRTRLGQNYLLHYGKDERDERTGKTYKRIFEVESGIDPGLLEPISLICTRTDGKHITSESYKYAARVIHYKLGIPCVYHSFRHTHATLLIENGADLKDVQKRLGHGKLSTTADTYVHATEVMESRSVDIFEKASLISGSTANK